MIIKEFWKTVRPDFSNKTKTANTILLSEKEKIITDETMVAKTLNNYFTDLTKNLELKENRLFSRKDTIADIVDYFKNCDSIKKMKEIYNCGINAFSF